METQQHVCPWWLGYTFIIPWRKYQHNPQTILGPHIKQGMTIMDYGSAMGYFSIHLARMTGETGKVICVDIQQKMIDNLMRRAVKRKLENSITPRLVGKDYDPAELKNQLDFVLLFAVVHEVPDKAALFNDLFSMMKQGAKILFAEPPGHVTPDEFKASLSLAQQAGLNISDEKPGLKRLAVLLVK